MVNLILRRVLIIGSLITILLGLDMMSDDPLIISLPTDFDVVSVLAQEKEQEAELIRLREEYYQIQNEIIDEYNQEIILVEDRLMIEQQELAAELEEQRLKEIEDAIKNAYTLGDRNKPEDYQKLFSDSIKHTFIIDFDTLEWEGLIEDMEEYNDLYGTYKSNNYRKVDVTYYADDEELFIPDVGIRSKGNIYSRYPPEDSNGNIRPIHYVLKFNETFDTNYGSQEYEWLKGREVFDLEKLIFKWNRVYDPTYINELYSYRLFKEAGVVIPEMNLAKYVIQIDGVTVSEELYTVQESMDEEFIRKHLQDEPTKEVGDLYKVIWPGTLEPINDMGSVGVRDWEANFRPTYGKETNQDIEEYSNLVNFTHQLDNLNGVALTTYLDNNFDVDMFIRSLAVNVLVGNPDDYRGNANNYYLYFDENNYLTFLPFDYDNSMGQGWNGEPVFINYTIGNDIYTWEGNGFSHYTDNIPLVEKVLSIEEYQILYEGYLEALILDGYFSHTYYSNLFDTFKSIYGDEFDMSYNKYSYITQKTQAVIDDIEYYRSLRD